MNSDRTEDLVAVAVESPEELSGARLGSRTACETRRLARLMDTIKPSIPLLPILGVYVLISLLIRASVGDEASFLSYATNLTHGFYAQTHSLSPAAYLWHGPGLPALLVPFVALHVPIAVTRILTGPLLLFAALVVFHRMVRPYLHDRPALIVTYLLAFVYHPFFTVMGRVFVEPLATLSFTLAAFFMVRSFRGGRRDHLWAAVALAVLALSRVEYGYVLAAALLLSIVWLLATRRARCAERSAIALAVALVLCAPWLVYTYSLTGRFFYWGNSGGLSLYWMSAPGNGSWYQESAVFTNPQLAVDRPVFTELKLLRPLDQDGRLQHIAFQNIRHNPGHYLSNVVHNIQLLLFNTSSITQSHPLGTVGPDVILLALLAVATAVALRARRRLGPEILPIAVLMVLGFAVHVPVAAYSRFVIPLVPVAAWLIVAVLSPHRNLVRDHGLTRQLERAVMRIPIGQRRRQGLVDERQ